MQYIFFDTNIYRQLGINYSEKMDYVNIRKLQEKGPNEFMIIDVVEKELFDYFDNEIISPLISSYEKLYLSFETNPFLPSIPLLELTKTEQEARKKFKKQVSELHHSTCALGYINPEEIIEFSISNKRESRKDNTRDFIILLTLIDFAKSNLKDTIVFITQDKIFTSNKYFIQKLKNQKVTNLLILESIPSYMNQFGFQLDFLNKEIVLESISLEKIKSELLNGIDCLPSYVSEYYHNDNEIPEIEKCDFSELQIYEYYTYPEEKNKIKIVTSVKVRVTAIYKTEKNVDLRNTQRKNYYETDRSHIDSHNRPIYDNYILFIHEGLVDQKQKRIVKQELVDFIPDWNVT